MTMRPIQWLALAAVLAGLPVQATPPEVKAEPAIQEGIQVPKPPFSEGIFPCTGCHDGKSMKVNTHPRQLVDMHGDIELHHGPVTRWCLDCHSKTNLNQVR